MTLKEEKQLLIDALGTVSDNPDFEATQLIISGVKISRGDFLYRQNETLSKGALKNINKKLAKRKKGYPLQYVLGEWEFYSLPFKVGKGVLIPRADSETLVDLAIEEIDKSNIKTVFDFCSGSGAIGIAISKNRPDINITLVEKSRKAFSYLKKNVELNGVKVMAIKEDIFKFSPHTKADLVVCNPPYIDKTHMSILQREVTKEPHKALFGGNDGLKYYRMLCKKANLFLKEKGKLMVEIGYNQGDSVKEIFALNGFEEIETIKDYSQNDRVVCGILK